ncbi:Argininosuccinate lyase [Frankliniella fusca]|uniref:Argininosuccinate lyase n=1 Tax=Frankliniella fusca TaxID=407009 RepID=A0AAE1HGN8_9NEOP|nr:Argininosuccinate lyase [Frankliniella fusca]
MRVTLWFASVIIVLNVVTVFSKRWINSFAGPYNFVSKRMFDCTLGEHGYDGSISHQLRVTHFNPIKPEEPQLMFGNVTRLLPVNDSFWGTFLIDKHKLDKSMPGIPTLPYGRYRSLEKIGFKDADSAVLCLYDEIDIIPKS